MSSAPLALLVDFGSTFTKVRAVDFGSGELVGSAQAPTTVQTNVMEGLRQAIAQLEASLGRRRLDRSLRLASSSAAGGLRIVAVGLIPGLTAEAARRAALGAGAKVLCTFAHELTAEDGARLAGLRPDIVVLSGGTDGGNRTSIVANARHLATLGLDCPIVVAGNRNAAAAVSEILAAAGCTFEVVDNVLPAVNRLAVEPCGAAIRRIFMERIVRSKGLDDAEEYVGRILMPTPEAVLQGCRLLALGPSGDDGLGELVCIDVGGATTDVYSVAAGAPSDRGVVLRGLPEPLVKRTVEGDLGLRVNAEAVAEAVGPDALPDALDGRPVHDVVTSLARRTDTLPESEGARQLDLTLGRGAASIALRRHAGTIEIAYGPEGAISVQVGKDLRATGLMIGTGGVFAANPERADEVFAGCFHGPGGSHLIPASPRCEVDRDYVLYAAGLLAEQDPAIAYRMGVAGLTPVRTTSTV